MNKTIFVQIASYRDDELPKTIESCLSAARHPERLRFGIVHQWDDRTRESIDIYKNDDRFRITELPWQESGGVGVARNGCNVLYGDEDFMIQIDSHMRFDQDWDEKVIAEWEACSDERAVLSAYPSPYRYDDEMVEERLPYGPTQLIVKKFFNGYVPVFKGMSVPARKDGRPRRAMYIAGGFIFGPGTICKEVPYVKDVSFMGEEMVYSVRLFTYGYTIYTPNWLGIYHLYERPESSRFWNDMPSAEEAAVKQRHEAMTRQNDAYLERFFAGNAPEELGQYATLQEFENYSGVSFKKKLISPKQLQLREPPYAYSDEWVDGLFPERSVSIAVDMSHLSYPEDRAYEMWRVKLLAEDETELYSVDIPYELLKK
jgi:hypothetical protein